MEISTLVLILWFIFWTFWITCGFITRVRVKKEVKGQSFLLRYTHELFVIIAMFLSLSQFHFKLWEKTSYKSIFIDLTGLIIVSLSLGFAISARIILGYNWNGTIQKTKNQRLIKTGPYHFVRHPIYTGITGGFFGTLITKGNIVSLVAFVIILVLYYKKIREEEKLLLDQFYPEYQEYTRETWAFIPLIF